MLTTSHRLGFVRVSILYQLPPAYTSPRPVNLDGFEVSEGVHPLAGGITEQLEKP
jgi:hypothetical protein